MIGEYHRAIKKALLEKIATEWEYKWSSFSKTLPDGIQNKFSYSFALKLKTEIEDAIGKENTPAPSDETLHKFLNKSPEETPFRIAILEKIAEYVKYINYTDFVSKNKMSKPLTVIYDQNTLNDKFKEIELLNQKVENLKTNFNERLKTVEVTNKFYKEKIKQKNRLVNRLIIFLIVIGVISIIKIFIIPLWKYTKSQPQITEIKNVIKLGANAEFSSYKNLPKMDVSELLNYFYKQGSAYKRIYNVLTKHVERERILTNVNNPSSYQIYDIKVLEMDDEKAICKTTERWYIRWWSTKRNDYEPFIYDSSGEQIYYLFKRNGKWLIDNNFYVPHIVETPKQ